MFEFSRLQKKCYPFDGMASDIAKMDEYDIENSRLSGDFRITSTSPKVCLTVGETSMTTCLRRKDGRVNLRLRVGHHSERPQY